MKKIKVLQNSNPYLYICRDHSGPYTADKKSQNFSEEIDNTKKSLLSFIVLFNK